MNQNSKYSLKKNFNDFKTAIHNYNDSSLNALRQSLIDWEIDDFVSQHLSAHDVIEFLKTKSVSKLITLVRLNEDPLWNDFITHLDKISVYDAVRTLIDAMKPLNSSELLHALNGSLISPLIERQLDNFFYN